MFGAWSGFQGARDSRRESVDVPDWDEEAMLAMLKYLGRSAGTVCADDRGSTRHGFDQHPGKAFPCRGEALST